MQAVETPTCNEEDHTVLGRVKALPSKLHQVLLKQECDTETLEIAWGLH